LTFSKDNDEDGFWPPIFSCMPAFEKTIPATDLPKCQFFRGLAPFFQIPADKKSSVKLPPKGLPKYHPYLSLRVRGVIHPIAAQPTKSPNSKATDPDLSIPGWQRVVMVMYKPNKRYLIEVLEHSEENYGIQFGTIVTSQMAQAGQLPQTTTTTTGAGAGGGSQPPIVSDAEVEAHLETYLNKRLADTPEWRDPEIMNRDVVEELEDQFRFAGYLDWNDIDYAYVYEGVVLPGGKIMLGRWWRCGMFGFGDGLELGADGVAVEVADDDEEKEGKGKAAGKGGKKGVDDDAMEVDEENGGGAGNATTPATPATATATATATVTPIRNGKLERGPFVFWC
jgi:hypothetical protein